MNEQVKSAKRLASLLTCLTVLGIACLSAWIAQAETTDRTVSFDLPAAPLTPLQKKRSPHAANLKPGIFQGRLRVPDVQGKTPAVVVIHTCHEPGWYDPWLNRLNEWGYATLSFSRCQPPGFKPDDIDMPSLDWKRGSLAAIGALRFLRSQPRVNGAKIGIMSWSRLGLIPLSILNYEGYAQFFQEKFAAGVALYPFCSFARGPHGGPILIIAGEEDSWIDNGVCKRVAQASAEDEFPVKIKVLPQAVHGFDIAAFGKPGMVSREKINPDGFAAGGGIRGYNPDAADIAVQEVKHFLEQHLK